jgi:hypothetical protein
MTKPEAEHERITLLVEIAGDYQSLCDDLAREPADYKSVIGAIDELMDTLKNARRRIKKLNRRFANEKN